MSKAPPLRVTGNDLTDSVLKDATVFGADGSQIGTVSHIDGVGPTASVTVDANGTTVTVNISTIDFTRDQGGPVLGHATWTKDQILDMPQLLEKRWL